jgi:hypothetical protein
MSNSGLVTFAFSFTQIAGFLFSPFANTGNGSCQPPGNRLVGCSEPMTLSPDYGMGLRISALSSLNLKSTHK